MKTKVISSNPSRNMREVVYIQHGYSITKHEVTDPTKRSKPYRFMSPEKDATNARHRNRKLP